MRHAEKPMAREVPITIELDSSRSDGERWSMFVAGDYVISRKEPPTADTTISPMLRERITDADLSILNFEAPIIPDSAEPVPKSGPVVENPPEAARAVSEAGFDVCTLANNHIRDYGPMGVASTIEVLSKCGLETVGVGETRDSAFEPVGVAGGSVGIVNVCEREFNIGEESYGAAWLSDRRAREAIADANDEFDTVIAIVHAGVEYAPFPPPELQGLLREFVDLGADLVFAHHPHVPQGWEKYRNSAIFYSLGNFLFDSMSESVNASWGLALEIRFKGAVPIKIELVPTEVVDGVVHELGEKRDRTEHLAYLHRLAEITGNPETLEPYWQEIAIHLFYERYSNWLHMGCGVNLPRARSDPHNRDAQRPVWDLEARRREILALLTIVRMESHRWTMTKALAVLTEETEDRRTSETSEEAQRLLSLAAR